LPNEEIEGRLIAQREVLAYFVARLISTGARDKEQALNLLETLEEQSIFQDHQEDPGAVPSGRAFAIEAAANREFRRILSDARGRIGQAGPEDRPPSGD